jgi:hypothetical protein
VALRLIVLWLAAYIVVRNIFPFAMLSIRLVELTVGEFLLVISRASIAAAAAAYLIVTSFRVPTLEDRHRSWCERWSGLALGVLALLFGSISIILLERRGVVLPEARWVAQAILSLIF